MSQAESYIKMLKIMIDGLEFNEKIKKLKKFLGEMSNLLTDPIFRKGINDIILENFKQNATLDIVDIIILLIKNAQSDDEKQKLFQTLLEVVKGSPIEKSPKCREALSEKIRTNFSKQGNKFLVDLILSLINSTSELNEIGLHAKALVEIIKGSSKEKDLIDYLETKRETIAAWKFNIIIKDLVKKKDKLILEAAKAFVRTFDEILTKSFSVKISLHEILDVIYEALGDYRNYYNEYYLYEMNKKDLLLTTINQYLSKKILPVEKEVKQIGIQLLASQLNLVLDISRSDVLRSIFTKVIERIKQMKVFELNPEKLNEMFSKELWWEKRDWKSGLCVRRKSSIVDETREVEFSLEYKYVPHVTVDSIAVVQNLRYLDSLNPFETMYGIFISAVCLTDNDSFRRSIIRFMFEQETLYHVKWALWLVGSLYAGTKDNDLKQMILSRKFTSEELNEVRELIIWALSMLCMKSNDIDVIQYIAELSQGIKEKRMKILEFAYGLIMKHPIDDNFRREILEILRRYVDEDLQFVLELAYAMFKGSGDIEFARELRRMVSNYVAFDENVERVINAIIFS